jgi:hypothetical protein
MADVTLRTIPALCPQHNLPWTQARVSRLVGKSSLGSFRVVVKCNGEPACEAYEVTREEPTQVLDPSGRTIPFRRY